MTSLDLGQNVKSLVDGPPMGPMLADPLDGVVHRLLVSKRMLLEIETFPERVVSAQYLDLSGSCNAWIHFGWVWEESMRYVWVLIG